MKGGDSLGGRIEWQKKRGVVWNYLPGKRGQQPHGAGIWKKVPSRFHGGSNTKKGPDRRKKFLGGMAQVDRLATSGKKRGKILG